MLGPERRGPSFELDAAFDDVPEELVVDLLVPFDLELHFCVAVTSGRDSVEELIQDRRFGRDGNMLRRCAKADDKCPIVGHHRLVPFDLYVQVRESGSYSVDDMLHAFSVVFIRE